MTQGYKALIGVGLLLASAAGGGVVGWQLRDRDYQSHLKDDREAERKAQEEARKLEGVLEDGSQTVRDEKAERDARIVYRTQTLIKEVPYYVPQTSVSVAAVDTSGGLPSGLVFLHNRAADPDHAPDTLPSGLTADTPSGIGLPELTGTVVSNYGTCQAYRSEALSWRSWYEKLVAEWPRTDLDPRKEKTP